MDKYEIDLESFFNNITSKENANNRVIRGPDDDDAKTEWVFLRFYEFEFKDDKSYFFEKKLKNTISYFSETDRTKAPITHVAMSYRLNDGFYGMFYVFNAENDVKYEVITKNQTDPKHFNFAKDINKSKYLLFAYPVTKKAYANLYYNLNKTMTSNNYNYQLANIVKSIFILSGDKIKNFIRTVGGREGLDKIKGISQEEIVEYDTKKQLVCSTFVMYLLENADPDLTAWKNKNKLGLYTITPKTLLSLPNLRFCFKGTWASYNKDAEQFIKKNPEFKKYLEK